MSKNLRTLQQSRRQRIEHDKVLSRLGDLDIRNLGVNSRIQFSNDESLDALIIEGLEATHNSGMDVDLSMPASVVQHLTGGVFIPFHESEDGASVRTLTIADGDGSNPRLDIIQGRVAKRNALLDPAADFISQTTKNITPQSTYRDFEYYLETQVKAGTPAASPSAPSPDGAEAATFTGSVALTGTLDLSVLNTLAIAVGDEETEIVEVTVSGATPSATTPAEVLSALNAAGFGTIASLDGSDFLQIDSTVNGLRSKIEFRPPVDRDADALEVLTGLSIADPYYTYIYSGANGWFKIAEILVPTGATVLLPADIYSRTMKDTDWDSDAATIRNSTNFDGHRTATELDHPDESVTFNKLASPVRELITGTVGNIIANPDVDVNTDNIDVTAQPGFSFSRTTNITEIIRGVASGLITIDDPIQGSIKFQTLPDAEVERLDKESNLIASFEYDEFGDDLITGESGLSLALQRDTTSEELGRIDAGKNILLRSVNFNGDYGAGTNTGLIIRADPGVTPIAGDQHIVENVDQPRYSDNRNHITALNVTEAVAAYKSNLATGEISIALLTRSNYSLTTDDVEVPLASGGVDVAVSRLSDTSFIVVYNDASNIYGRVCTVSGSAITMGAQTVIAAIANARIQGVAGLTASLFAVSYFDNTPELFTVAATVSGTSLTPGSSVSVSATPLDPATNNVGSIIRVDDTRFAVSYMTNTPKFRIAAGSISGATITLGTAVAPIVADDDADSNAAINLVNINEGATTYVMTVLKHSVASPRIATVSITGTTISQFTDGVPSTVPDRYALQKVSDRRVLLVYSNDNASEDSVRVSSITFFSGNGTGPLIFQADSYVALSQSQFTNNLNDMGMAVFPDGVCAISYMKADVNGDYETIYARLTKGHRSGKLAIDRIFMGRAASNQNPDVPGTTETGNAGLLDLKMSLDDVQPSADHPWFRIDQNRILNDADWSPTLISKMREMQFADAAGGKVWAVTAATKYDSNTNVRLTLESGSADWLADLLEEYYYYAFDFATGNSTVSGALFDSWGMVVVAMTDIGDGAGKIAKGTEMYVQYVNANLDFSISPVNYYLGMEYLPDSGIPTDSIGTVTGGTVAIFPCRYDAIAGVTDATKAIWRAKPDSTIYTPGEVAALVSRRDSAQNHYHSISHNAQYSGGGAWYDWGGFNNFIAMYGASVSASSPIANGGGNPRLGTTNRGRSLSAYIYAYGGSYAG